MKKKKLNELLKLNYEDGLKYEHLADAIKKIEVAILQGAREISRKPFNGPNGAKVWREHLKPALEAYDFLYAAALGHEQVVKDQILREKRGEKKESGSEDNKSEE